MDLLKPYGDTISVVGALLIFFSWVATNIMIERFKGAKAAFLEASGTFRLYSTLNSIHSSIESVAAEAIHNGGVLNELRWHFDQERRSEPDESYYIENNLNREIASSGLNARQIDWGLAACRVQVEQSASDRRQTESGAALQRICKELEGLKIEKDAIFEQASAYRIQRRTNLKIASTERQAGLDKILQPFRHDVLPRFAPLLERFVTLANTRQAELRADVELARERTSQSVLRSHSTSPVHC